MIDSLRAELAKAKTLSTRARLLAELGSWYYHEIQNPLNFVNNFSEVSMELVSELREERDERDEGLEAELLGDWTQNLQKITRHGGKASAIVKGMLEHSRSSTGQREPTDLNALADEYLRLAYQGMRAKDKTFNCELITDFLPDLGQVAVVPQEIGLGIQGVEIRVSDNGMGISDAVKAKIFQPFFTTKPTGEGTGLGLSLSYDIVTKGHGGTLAVESAEGEGTEFIITLPA